MSAREAIWSALQARVHEGRSDEPSLFFRPRFAPASTPLQGKAETWERHTVQDTGQKPPAYSEQFPSSPNNPRCEGVQAFSQRKPESPQNRASSAFQFLPSQILR